MNKLKCYNVVCKDADGNVYEVGVMTFDESSAKHSAENSLFEGKHVKVTAIEATETDRI